MLLRHGWGNGFMKRKTFQLFLQSLNFNIPKPSLWTSLSHSIKSDFLCLNITIYVFTYSWLKKIALYRISLHWLRNCYHGTNSYIDCCQLNSIVFTQVQENFICTRNTVTIVLILLLCSCWFGESMFKNCFWTQLLNFS